MSVGNGWIGTMSQLAHVLRTYGADQDEEGKFKIFTQAPATFLGLDGPDAEVVVPCDCECEIRGQRCNVAGLLYSTSYGMKITVII
jgi:hypothetical protein